MPGGARSTLVAGGAVSEFAGAAGAGVAAAAGSAGFGAAAFTAAWQDGESLASLRSRHSNASLPPGWTPEQLAMKSERQAARMASRWASVGCWAAACSQDSVSSRPANAKYLNIAWPFPRRGRRHVLPRNMHRGLHGVQGTNGRQTFAVRRRS